MNGKPLGAAVQVGWGVPHTAALQQHVFHTLPKSRDCPEGPAPSTAGPAQSQLPSRRRRPYPHTHTYTRVHTHTHAATYLGVALRQQQLQPRISKQADRGAVTVEVAAGKALRVGRGGGDAGVGHVALGIYGHWAFMGIYAARLQLQPPCLPPSRQNQPPPAPPPHTWYALSKKGSALRLRTAPRMPCHCSGVGSMPARVGYSGAGAGRPKQIAGPGPARAHLQGARPCTARQPAGRARHMEHPRAPVGLWAQA